MHQINGIQKLRNFYYTLSVWSNFYSGDFVHNSVGKAIGMLWILHTLWKHKLVVGTKKTN